MHLSTTAAFLSLLSAASAHFRIEYPTWRGDSFADDASQWIFPCANVSETTDITNRTAWSPEGGSLRLHVSHPWALTYVNMGIGTNITSFNVSLVEGFNQTGNGTFCLPQTGRAALQAALETQGIENPEGVEASLQVIQISHTGASLYNCADVVFNATAALLADDECRNSTGVGGVAIQNVGAAPAANGTEPENRENAAGALRPVWVGLGAAVVGGVVALL